ncbi:TPA: RNA-directed DNA polymerase [Morganella morganii]|uniref:RNA-directed DNA polymerase n=1 Tax=Morganella morganii TaxID=582 RepID=UPI00301DF599
MKKKLFSKDYITVADVYLAYRKAKAEAFFDNFYPNAISFSEFEKDINNNILKLHSIIINGEHEWWEDASFIGKYYYVPKSLDDSSWNNSLNVHYSSVDPIEDWKRRFEENKNRRLKPKYRLIQSPSVEYQIISTLWILKVGHKFEARLDKNLSYGNRLRRKKHIFEGFGSYNGPVNLDSSSLFSPYFSAYKNWRNKGLNKMKELIEEGCSVTAITMDLESFYHSASANFILRPSFLKKINVDLNNDEKKFTTLFLNSITSWYKETPDFKKREEGALPVGLSASKVISNVLLYELDVQIQQGLDPSYYGRYVDDIFLVFKTPVDLSVNGDAILTYMSKHVECLKIKRESGEQPALRLRFNYATDSVLKFTASKQKIFSLSGKHGLDFIDQIASQIKAQSSEYRMLPEVPKDSVEMANKTLLASENASLSADALRKADGVSVRRLGLSLLLRDIESYSEDLSSEEWEQVRIEFYGLVERYLLTPKGLFDLFGYLHRVFKLMITNGDFHCADNFMDKFSECLKLIGETTDKSTLSELDSCREYFFERLFEVALQSSTTKSFDKWGALRKLLIKLNTRINDDVNKLTKTQIKELSYSLLLADFGYRSYKDYWYYTQAEDINETKIPRRISVRKILRLALIKKFRESAELKIPHWPALAFPTRPLSIQEIAIICPKVFDEKEDKLFRDSILGLRGAKTPKSSIGKKQCDDDGVVLAVPSHIKSSVYIALTNFETTNTQYQLALSGKPDISLKRYEKINTLVNNILKSTRRCDYIVFPECSLPRRWAVNIAGKLARQKISLIAGIEYYKYKNSTGIVRNDCLLSLATNWPGYHSNILVLQPKHSPSHGERQLLSENSLKLFESNSDTSAFPVYKHGKFHFGTVICSDLTNPLNRVRFQGRVDCLFVLEWNPDVKTFSFLVEGTSHDTHSFVVQVNNRTYGDSRVRAPYRADYKRDSVRVKGGLSDTHVIAEVNYTTLRKFQKKGIMTDDTSEFKPVPIGFKMSNSRK